MREPKTLVEKVWERHVVHRAEGNERPTFAAPVAATTAGDVARRKTRHKRSAKTPPLCQPSNWRKRTPGG
jgi:hypothetical protein